MAGKITLPHHLIVAEWKEEKVIKWLRRVHLDDCIPAFQIRHIDGTKLLELSEQKLFTYQDLKIKHRKQIAKCVQECKSQASNAKRLAQTIKLSHESALESPDPNGAYDSGDDWGSDFDDSEDEEKNEELSAELNNNSIIQPSCDTFDRNPNTNSALESNPAHGKPIPKPPDIPVISKNINGISGTKISNSATIPRPLIKRPPSQPPPPPVAQVSSHIEFQEDYEIPILSSITTSEENLSIESTHQNIVSNDNSVMETYELIEPPEETYEIVDAPMPSHPLPEKPSLPPRLPITTGTVLTPPPLPMKPRRLKDNIVVSDKTEGVKTFSRPKLPVKTEEDSLPDVVQTQISSSNISFISSFIGRKSSSTPLSSPKSPQKNSVNIPSSNGPVVSSNESHTSRSSSPDKYKSCNVSEIKKTSPLPPLPPRSGFCVSDDTVQSMATRPLPPVPVPKQEKPITEQLDIASNPWYQEIERQDAEQIVKNLNETGSFVVRPSKRAGKENPFSLTILHEGKLFHLNIRQRSDNTFALGKEKRKEKTFSSVSELISFHQAEPILLTSRGEPAGRTILSRYPENV